MLHYSRKNWFGFLFVCISGSISAMCIVPSTCHTWMCTEVYPASSHTYTVYSIPDWSTIRNPFILSRRCWFCEDSASSDRKSYERASRRGEELLRRRPNKKRIVVCYHERRTRGSMPAGVSRHQNDTYTRPINWRGVVLLKVWLIYFSAFIDWVSISNQSDGSFTSSSLNHSKQELSLWELRLGNQLKCFFYLFI